LIKNYSYSLTLSLAGFSGAAALGWQLLWTEQLGLALGHESVSMLAVMAAFFGGTSLGAWAYDQNSRAHRWPGRVYIACEIMILSWGALLYYLLPFAAQWGLSLVGGSPSTGLQLSVAFFLPFFILLPATAAMGATLPAFNAQLYKHRSAWSGLYAANTAGAMAGVLLVVLYAAPQWGFQRTGLACMATNGACALLAGLLWRNSAKNLAVTPTTHQPDATQGFSISLACTGFLGVSYEVVVARVLGGVTENTIYSYAAVLSVYLFATALGAGWYHQVRTRGTRTPNSTANMLLAQIATLLLSMVALWHADLFALWPRGWLESSTGATLAGEVLVACATLMLPAAVMGAVYAGMCDAASLQGLRYSKALTVNTAGAALAPLFTGVVAIPWLGSQLTLAGIVMGYGLLWVFWMKRRRIAALVFALLAPGLWAAPPLRFVRLAPGSQLIDYKEGVMASVSVIKDADGITRLQINNRVQEGSSASGPFEARLAQIPLALHPSPHRALFLGVGTGYTSQVAAKDKGLQVAAVELLPEVLEATGFFAQSHERKKSLQAVHFIRSDARRFVQIKAAPYDVIVGDLFHPARNGAGSLYTREQFAHIKARLAPGGVYCQWLALYQMDNASLRSIMRAFLAVYPKAVAILATNSLESPAIGLIGRMDDELFSVGDAKQRLLNMQNGDLLGNSQLNDEFALFGNIIGDSDAIMRFSLEAPINTDDLPFVTHQAPWVAYSENAMPRDRLLEFLNGMQVRPELVFENIDAATAHRFEKYWQARRAYLALGMQVKPSVSAKEALDQVEGSLLNILQQSPEFQPARMTLMQLSQAISKVDAARALALRQAIAQ
jgi:spermidine synthase